MMSQGQSLSGHYQDELSGHNLLLLLLYSHSNTSRKCAQMFQLCMFYRLHPGAVKSQDISTHTRLPKLNDPTRS